MSVQSLERAFDIVELLSRRRQGMRLTEIAKSLDLHKSTVYRLISTLKGRGYIEKDTETGNYRLGLVFIAITSQYLNNLEIKAEAEPFLRKLSERLGETVFLAILRDDEVVYIDKVERFDSLRRYSIIGQRRPINCTSLGKSLMMDKKPGDIRQVFSQKPMKKLTSHTIVDVDEYLNHLEMVRKRGWSNDAEEYEKGVSCVGAPIRDYRGQIIAAISSAWEGSKDAAEVRTRGELIKSVADDISQQIGYFQRG